MKRSLITSLIALVGATALTLAACGGGGDNANQPEPRPQPDCQAKPGACK